MRTLDEQNRDDFSASARLKRNLRLARRIAGMVLGYFTVGRRVRRRYRDAERRGEVYLVDHEPS